MTNQPLPQIVTFGVQVPFSAQAQLTARALAATLKPIWVTETPESIHVTTTSAATYKVIWWALEAEMEP